MSDNIKMSYGELEDLLEEAVQAKTTFIADMEAGKNKLSAGVYENYIGKAGTETGLTADTVNKEILTAFDETIADLRTEITKRKEETQAQEEESKNAMAQAVEQGPAE